MKRCDVFFIFLMSSKYVPFNPDFRLGIKKDKNYKAEGLGRAADHTQSLMVPQRIEQPKFQ